MTYRVGFCCKWIDFPSQVNGLKHHDAAKKYNTGTTTIAWLDRQSQEIAERKLWSLVKQNIEATRLLVERVSTLDEQLRMVRLSSDILPAYTHRNWRFFYNLSDVRTYCETAFKKIGDLARSKNVRLSFHPGQFCVLASANDNIVQNSIEEFEYHVDMARWMGYGNTWHDHGFKINVHLAGRGGAEKFLQTLNKLSPEARNLITIENEEITYGLDHCLVIADSVPVVCDIHHHLVHTNGYIKPDDPRVLRVIDSWRGVRPVLHYSVSRENLLREHDPDCLLAFDALLESGHKKQKLRAHSDFMWNTAMNKWAYEFTPNFDIQVEAKGKNLASFDLYNSWKEMENGNPIPSSGYYAVR